MELGTTAKIQIYPTLEQVKILQNTMIQVRNALNYVSEYVFSNKCFSRYKVQENTYYQNREQHGLRSQMAVSVVRTVIAKYKTNKSNGHDFTLVKFKNLEYDLVWNKDYSLKPDNFSVNSLQGRLKIPYETQGMEKYFDNIYKFGTAKLVYKFGKYFLHIPVTKNYPVPDDFNIDKIVGIDLGINFLATVYDSKGKTTFHSGKKIKDKRGQYKDTRKKLQQRGTASARQRIRTMGQRENRHVTDVNHTITKALVNHYGKNTLFVLEDLSGVRLATERVRKKDRYVSVSWAFYQFRQFLEYKATLNGAKVLIVDPAYTSQMCPKCGHIEKANRNKKQHIFKCKNCAYTSNDDRIGAMNLWFKGLQHIESQAKGHAE